MLAVKEDPPVQPTKEKTPSHVIQAATSTHPHIFEVIRPTVVLLEKRLAFIELAGDATPTFGGIRAVEEGDMLVADVSEPRGSRLD